jgi:hypothetical protein
MKGIIRMLLFKELQKAQMYALCQKYEELYFNSLNVKIKDIPPRIRTFSSCIYLQAFKRIKTITEFNQLIELLEDDILSFPHARSVRRLLLIHLSAYTRYYPNLKE